VTVRHKTSLRVRLAECNSAILVAIRKSKSLLGAGMCSSRLIKLWKPWRLSKCEEITTV